MDATRQSDQLRYGATIKGSSMGGTKKKVTLVTKDGKADTPAGLDAVEDEALGEEFEEEWEEEWEEEEDGEQDVEEIDEVAEMKRQQQEALARQNTALQRTMTNKNLGLTLGRTYTRKELDEIRGEAQSRRKVLQQFCKNNGYTSFDALNRILQVYYEQSVEDQLTYLQFTKFIRVDDSLETRSCFDALLGRVKATEPGQLGRRRKKLETKILILYMLNCLPKYPKEDKLKFAFNLFDEEESRVIPFVELKRILQANYFASCAEDVEKKAGIIFE